MRSEQACVCVCDTVKICICFKNCFSASPICLNDPWRERRATYYIVTLLINIKQKKCLFIFSVTVLMFIFELVELQNAEIQRQDPTGLLARRDSSRNAANTGWREIRTGAT